MKRTLLQATLLTFTTLLFISACSIKTVYNNLDWVLEGMVNDYVSLSDTQEQDLEKQVALLLKWHRASQLTEYANDLKATKAFVDKGMDDESVEIIITKMLERWESMKVEVAPKMADLLVTLNDEQIEELFSNLEEKNKEIADEYTETSDDEKIVQAGDRLIDKFNEWLGTINDDQKELIKYWSQSFKPIHEDRLLFRKQWQLTLRQVIESDFEDNDKRNKLVELVMNAADYQSEGYKLKLDYNRDQFKKLIVAFESVVTPEQKKHLNERLDYFITNFEELAVEAKNNQL